jgi:hypothetical protein
MHSASGSGLGLASSQVKKRTPPGWTCVLSDECSERDVLSPVNRTKQVTKSSY